MPEPIHWSSKKTALQRSIPARRFNPSTGQMEEAFDNETGERLYERIPQRGHVGGDYENPVAGRSHWMHVLRHDGHVVRVKLTCAAADYDLAQLTSQERQAKARHLGWIPVGHCPIALVGSGTLRREQLVAKELRSGQTPCQHGTYGELKHCPHYTIEATARQALQTVKQAKADRALQPESEKLVEAQRQQTKELVSAIADAVRDSQPPAAPEKGKPRT